MKRPGRPKGSKNRHPRGGVIKIRDLDETNPLSSYLDDVQTTQGLNTRSAAGQMVIADARARRLFLPSSTDTSIVLEPTP